MSEATQITVSQLNRTHVGRTVTISDPTEGSVTGELRQIFHMPTQTVLYINRPRSEVPEWAYFEVTLSVERSGIGEAIGLVEHVPAIDSPVVLAEESGRTVAELHPSTHDTADRSALSESVVEVFHDGNGSELETAQ